jgi:hypothetical protein
VAGGLKRLLSLNARPTIANRQATKTTKTTGLLAGFAIGFSFFHPNPRASGFLHRLEPDAIHPKCMSTLISSTMTLINVPYWTSDNQGWRSSERATSRSGVTGIEPSHPTFRKNRERWGALCVVRDRNEGIFQVEESWATGLTRGPCGFSGRTAA